MTHNVGSVMTATPPLPDQDHILRFVPKKLILKAADGQIRGVFPHAFQLRDGEDYLSATWVEYFSGTRDQQLIAAGAATAATLKVKAKDGFVLAGVGAIKAACEKVNVRTRILHEPDPPNNAHAAIRGLPRENDRLLELLASEAVTATIDAPSLGSVNS